MTIPQIVIDTNVLVSGLRSQNGAAFQLLRRVGTPLFDIHLSVPLVLEYEAVLLRRSNLQISKKVIDDALDFHCAVAVHHLIFFLWRPYLPDSKDDMVLELAVKAGCDRIITYNIRDFAQTERFGIRALTPKAFLQEIGELP